MIASLHDIPASALGERLRAARENAGVTQANAARFIEAARTTLVAIEKGERRVRLPEIQMLCRMYGTSVNALLHREAPRLTIEPQFRKLSACSDESIVGATRLLSDLVRAELELENLLGIKRVHNLPPQRPLLGGDVRMQAEQDAFEVRQWLGIGSGPISDIITVLEIAIGARVYVRKLDGRISGLFIFDLVAGPCILLNAIHPVSRRHQSAAHELAHLIASRNNPEVYRNDVVENTREERYADAFARAFMTPARILIQKFREITAGSDKLTRRHVIILAHFFSVSREALVRRLEELDLVKKGTWDWFSNEGGITDVQARQVLGERMTPESGEPSIEGSETLRLNLLANQIYLKGILSEGQLARLMGIGRVELRRVLDESEQEGGEASGAPIIP